MRSRRAAAFTPSQRTWRPSLQMYLTSVVLALAIVVALIVRAAGATSVEQATQRTVSAVEFRADLAATEIDDAIASTMSRLEDTARNPYLTAASTDSGAPGCNVTFEGVGPFGTGHIDLVDLSGRIRCSSAPGLPSASDTAVYAAASWLAVTGDDATVTGPLTDQATGKRVLVVAASVPGDGVVAAFLDLDVLAPGLSKRLSGPLDVSFALVAAESGAVELPPSSPRWIEATAPVASLRWDVRAWTSSGDAVAAAQEFNERLRWLLLGAAAFLLLSLQVLSLVVARPIRRLSTTVRGLVAGEPAPAVPASGPAEVVSLAEDFSRLMHAVERERHQRERAEAYRAGAQAEREAHASMLDAVMRNAQSLIYVKDLDGRYLMVNPAFEAAVARPQADILGQTAASISPSGARRWDTGDLLARDGTIHVEEHGDAPDGTHYFDTVKFPLHDARGVLYATCGVSLDVTSRHRETAAIAGARDAALAATEAKTMFLAAMSHEIRTPMTAVIGMTGLLAHTDLDSYQRELISTVQSSSDALLGVINNVLDLSKIESGELHLEHARFDLRNEVERCLDVVAIAAAEKHLDVVCDVDDSCPSTVVGDVIRVRQIAMNLVANAVKFTEAGQVLIEVLTQDTGDGQLVAIITVTDTGIGIAPAALGNLFTSFSQVDASTTRVYGGSGLGLTIAQRVARTMGGDIVVASATGVGSTFIATVVLDVDPDAEPAPPGPTPTSPLVGRRVLVVDDNAVSLRTLGKQLGRLGMHCTLVESAAAALESYGHHTAYDVVLADMLMPVNSGVELGVALQELFAEPPAAPMILMTDFSLHASETEGIFAAVLSKPVKSAALRDVVTSVLTGSASPTVRPKAPAADAVAPGLRVLLAEDHPVNQRVVELMLRQLGHSVDVVGDGAAAVEAVEDYDYDVVLMDLHMPLMDGLESTRRIRANTAGAESPRIIAMTASALLDDRHACAAAGMDGFLSKPVRAWELDDSLRSTTRADQGEAVSALVAGNGHAVPVPAGSTAEASDAWLAPVAATPALAVSAEPAVDLAVLHDVVQALDMDGNELRDALIADYLSEGAQLVEQLATAASTADEVAVASAAHKLRSPSALLGAATLADLLLAAERGGPDRTVNELTAITGAIAAEYAAVDVLLRSLLTQDSPARERAYST